MFELTQIYYYLIKEKQIKTHIMIFDVTSELIERFLNLPETGMGYQIIDGIPEGKNYLEKFVVYNSELIVELDNQFEGYKRKIISEGFTKIRKEAPFLELKRFNFIPRSNIINGLRSLNESEISNLGRHSGGKGADASMKEYANGIEVFVRLSAYEDDKRIDFVNNCLKSGSYATTETDYVMCKYLKDDPVDRYALPNDERIAWTFYMKPNKFDILQRGTVQPLFGHTGGGVEAYFENGTSHETYLYKERY